MLLISDKVNIWGNMYEKTFKESVIMFMPITVIRLHHQYLYTQMLMYLKGLSANLTKQSIVSTFSSHINTLNNDLHSGKYTVQSNGELVNSSDSNFYVQGGVTKDITYWWGKKRYTSTYATNLWIDKLNSDAALNAGAGIIAGAVLGGIGGVPNGTGFAYAWKFASDISYVNHRSNRGIVANITWALTYSIRKQ